MNIPQPPFPVSGEGGCGAGTWAARRVNERRKTPGSPLWQRGYCEHIVRNDEELADIREYIVNNLMKWELDRYNPDRQT